MCYIFFHKLSLDLTNSRAYCQKIKLKSYKTRLNFDFLTKNKGRVLSNKAHSLFYYSNYNKKTQILPNKSYLEMFGFHIQYSPFIINITYYIIYIIYVCLVIKRIIAYVRWKKLLFVLSVCHFCRFRFITVLASLFLCKVR